MEIIYRKEDTQRVVQDFLSTLPPSSKATILLFHGELGAGKTSFVQALVKKLGWQGEVLSPTFVIQKQYPVVYPPFELCIHIDAYRLTSGKEMIPLGWTSLIESPQNIICVEWGELIQDVLPKEVTHLYIRHVDEETRGLIITHEN